MRSIFNIASSACLLGALSAGAASDFSFTVRQNWPWDTRILIDVAMPEGTNDVELTASFVNGGVRHEIALDCGTGLSMSPFSLTGGVHRLVWDPAACGYAGAISALDISAKACSADEHAWIVIDLDTGAAQYVALGDEQKDATGRPWQDLEYKTSKMVFRRIPAGTFTRGYTADEKSYVYGLDGGSDNTVLTAAETTLTSDYYISIYETTKAQVCRIVDGNSSYLSNPMPDAGVVCASGFVCFQRGSNSVEGINWPFTKFAVTPTSIVGRFRSLCGNRFMIDLPTCAQWQKAARPDSKWLWYDTSSYPGGLAGGTVNDSYDALTNIVAHISDGYRRAFGGVAYEYSPPDVAGMYLPNPYGLYDLVGSRLELVLDMWNGNAAAAASAGIDPVGMAQQNYNYRMMCNSYSQKKTLTQWLMASASAQNVSDAAHKSGNEFCYRYVIHLNPPQSFGGKWFNE